MNERSARGGANSSKAVNLGAMYNFLRCSFETRSNISKVVLNGLCAEALPMRCASLGSWLEVLPGFARRVPSTKGAEVLLL